MSQTTLYQHVPHPHTPRNVNDRHAAERRANADRPGWRGRASAFNDALAIWITTHSGSMGCAYLFFGIGVGSLIGVLTNDVILAAICGSVSSYVIQLVMLPILQKGQNIVARQAELQADEAFKTAQGTYHHLLQVARHQDAQDAELLRQSAEQRRQMDELLRQTELLLTIAGHLFTAAPSLVDVPVEAVSVTEELPPSPAAPAAPAPKRRRSPRPAASPASPRT